MNRPLLPTVLIVAFLAVGCGDDNSGGQTIPLTTIVQRDFVFDPDGTTLLHSLTLRSEGISDQNQVKIVNEGAVEHTFTVDTFSIDETVSPGGEKLVNLPKDLSSFEFYCRFHEAQGMRGSLGFVRSSSATLEE